MTKIKLLLLSVCFMLSAVFVGASAATTAFAAENEEHEHWWHITDYVEPTCTEDGYTQHVCFYCEEEHRDNYIPALGHEFLEIVIEPTCTSRGYTTYFCSVCGFEYVDNYVERLEHDFEEEVITSTCTTDGYTLYTCKTDGHSYKDNYIYAYGHNYIPDALEPTCIEGGYTTYTCDDCDDSYVADYTEPTGHDHHEHITLPTCVAYGYTEHICDDCGDKYVTDYIKPNGHNCEKTVIKPTQASAGYTINVCKDCGYSYLSDFVTSGDEHFEEHNHEHSLFVARYDEQEYFVLQNYCECGEVDNSLVKVLFIDEDGNYTALTINENGEVHYSNLYGDYNVYILNNSGEMLTNFKVRAGEIPQVHNHDYSLTVTRNDEDGNFIIEYKCDCGEADNSLLNVLFIDEGGNYITIAADENGKVDYTLLSSGSYNVFILNNQGNMLSSFKVTIPEEVIPEEHFHDFVLSIARNDEDKYFTIQYVCRCGDIQNAVINATFIDENGNVATLTADENGKVDYSQFVGNFNVFILGEQGEMLSNFRLEVIAEHIHDYSLTVTLNEDEGYFTIENLCECGEAESIVFHIIIIDKDGSSLTMGADANGKVDFSQLDYGKYNVVILSNQGERLSNFELLIVEKEIHNHDYSLSVIRNNNGKFLTVQYVCDCGEIQNAVFNVTFMDENGNVTVISANAFGKVDYSSLPYGNYTVFILDGQGEMLSTFKLSFVAEHIHDYTLSVIRNDEELNFTLQYLCECGEVKNAVFYAVFSNGSNYVTINADSNGKVDYSSLACGKYNVAILSGQGGMLYSFELIIAEEEVHTHDFKLSVIRNDNGKFLTVQYLCECGEIENAVFNVTFIDENGNATTIKADQSGKVDYSQIPYGIYNGFILDGQGNMLSTFKMSFIKEHIHEYSLSVIRNDNEKHFIVQYACECGDTQNAIFYAIFMDENDNYVTLSANENGKINYSQLIGNYNVFILDGEGKVMTSFKLFAVEETIHFHDFTLSVAINDNEKYFTTQYVCKCGEIENVVFHVILLNKSGDFITLYANEDGEIYYSHLEGDFTVYISDNESNVLSTFELSVYEDEIPNEPPVEDDNAEPLKNSALPVILAILLVLIAAVGVAVFLFKKKRNKNK